MWEKLSRFILAKRYLLLAFFLLATAFMAWQGSKVRLSFNAGKMLPLTDSAYIRYDQFKARFGEDGSVMVLGIQSDKLFQRDLFNDWLKLNDDIQKIEGIKQVVSVGKLVEFSKDTLQKKFVIKPVATWPVASQADMDSIKCKIANLPFYKGLVYNPEKNVTLMAITFTDSVLNSSDRIGVIQTIVDASKAFSEKHKTTVHYSGLPYIRTVISDKVSQEFALFIGLSIAVAALILFLFFRSFSAVFFPLLVVLIGVVWSLGILVIFGYDITLLTGLIPPLIVVIGIPNSILLINKYHNEYTRHGDQPKALQTVIERIAITTFIANLTTAIGFGVLYFTNSELLMQFGVVASLSVIATWLMSLCLIPIIFSFLPPPNLKHTRHLSSPLISKLLAKLDVLAHQRRNWIYASTLMLLIVAGIGLSRIKINGYVVDDLPQKDAIYQDMGFFSENFKGIFAIRG